MRAILLRQCQLKVLTGSNPGRSQLISSDVIRIGKVEGNDLVLQEDTVSRVHCEIIRDPRGYLLRDLQSTNGTFVDGAEVREAYLRSGSVITVGAVDVQFEPVEERVAVTASQQEQLGPLVGRSLAMREIFGLVQRIAPTNATVLIQGEPGTGKELLARELHAQSLRRDAPFVVARCGTLEPGREEALLLGQAATDGEGEQPGLFEQAHGGTLYIDGLEELSLALQPKVLRVLEQREVRAVGGSAGRRIDIRVLAAAGKDLQQETAKGKFDEQLLFRLSMVSLKVPPLRRRKEDIPLLVEQFAHQLGQASFSMPDEALDVLLAHDWPGNVQELRSVLERGMYLSKHMGEDAFKHLNIPGLQAPVPPGDSPPSPSFDPQASYRENKERWNDEFEKRYLQWLLARAEGNISRAAREAGMDRKYLHKLIKKHKIDL